MLLIAWQGICLRSAWQWQGVVLLAGVLVSRWQGVSSLRGLLLILILIIITILICSNYKGGNSILADIIINQMQDNPIEQQLSQPIPTMPLDLQQKLVHLLSEEIATQPYPSALKSMLGLLIDQVTHKENKRPCFQKEVSILLAHSMKRVMNSANNELACQTLFHMLFEASIPIQLKLMMHESVAQALLLSQNQKDSLYSRMKTLLMQKTRPQHTDTFKIGSADVCRLALMVVEKLVEQTANTQQIQCCTRAAQLLLQLRTLLVQLGLKNTHVSLYAGWLKIYSSFIKQLLQNIIENGQIQPTLKKSLIITVKNSHLCDLGQAILTFQAVCYNNNSCPYHISEENQSEIFQLVMLYFQLLQSIYDLKQSLDSPSLIAEQDQLQMLDWVLGGIHCYIQQQRKTHNRTSKIKVGMQQLEYRLQAVLVNLYYQITNRRYQNLEYFIEKGLNLNQNMLLPLLEFSSYEQHLFEQDTEYFLDIVEDFANGKTQIASPKTRLSQVIRCMVQVVPNFKLQFILMAKFQLQRTMSCYISGYYDGSQSSTSSMSAQSSLLMLCLFASDLAQSQKELQYLRQLFNIEHVANLSDLCLALLFELAILLEQDIISNQRQTFNAFDLALESKNGAVRVACLRCLQYFCSLQYYPRYFATLIDSLERGINSKSDLRFVWNILRTTVQCHASQINVQTLNWLMSTLKKLILKQLLSKTIYSNIPQTSIIVHPSSISDSLDICATVIQQLSSQNGSNQFATATCVSIALLYLHVHGVEIKQELLIFIRRICHLATMQKIEFPIDLLSIVPQLVEDLHAEDKWDISAVLESVLLELGRKRRPKLLRKVRIILPQITEYFQMQVQKLQKSPRDADPAHLYAYLVILNRLVQYFGSQISKQTMYGWLLGCRKIQMYSEMQGLQVRISNFIFSCSLYLREAAMFATMLQQVGKQPFSNYEKQMLLDTLQAFFTCPFTAGGVGKYVYLIKILYALITQPLQLEQTKSQQNMRPVVQNFVAKCKTQSEFEQSCLKVYLLFKTHKYSLYSFLVDYIQSDIMRQFHTREALLQGCQLLSTNTFLNYQTANSQLDPIHRHKLQKYNPLYACQSFRESFFVPKLVISCQHEQQQRYIEDICRKMIKQ